MSSEEAPEEETPSAGCGERLRDARREQQISIDEIAKELHIDEAKVRALESNDFETLGAPVFAKGHLRKYAQLVKVDEDDVFAEYHALTHKDGLPPVVSSRRRPTLPKSPTPLVAITAAVVIIAVAAAAYWFFIRGDEPEPVQEAPAPAEQAVTREAQAPPPVTRQVTPEPAPVDDTPVATAEPQPEVTVVDEVADDLMRIRLSFSGDCWTEVTDGSGQRLFFDLGQSGRTVDLSGEAPVSVLFGNASNVDVVVDGVDYTIDPADRRGETARFTLYGN